MTVRELIDKLQRIAADNGGDLQVEVSETFFTDAVSATICDDRGDETRHVIICGGDSKQTLSY